MSDKDSVNNAKANCIKARSPSRRQTLAFLGSLSGLGLISSQPTVADEDENECTKNNRLNVDSNTEFSIAVFPDTQLYTEQDNQIFEQMSQWVANNKEEYNIKMFLHEGDLVQNYGSGNEDEWDIAEDSISRIDDADIPTVLSLGNHDADNMRDPQVFRDRFPKSRYEEIAQTNETILNWGTFEGYSENAYLLQEIHGDQFLFITLEFGPRNAAVKWAGEVLQDHPQATGILVTHTYMYHDGTRTNATDEHAPSRYVDGSNSAESGYIPRGNEYSNGDQMWRAELRYRENLAIVQSGHHINGPFVAQRTDLSDTGMQVKQLFMDYQTIDNGGDGWFRLLTINTESNEVEVNTYSPYLDSWSKSSEESFTFSLMDDAEPEGGN